MGGFDKPLPRIPPLPVPYPFSLCIPALGLSFSKNEAFSRAFYGGGWPGQDGSSVHRHHQSSSRLPDSSIFGTLQSSFTSTFITAYESLSLRVLPTTRCQGPRRNHAETARIPSSTLPQSPRRAPLAESQLPSFSLKSIDPSFQPRPSASFA